MNSRAEAAAAEWGRIRGLKPRPVDVRQMHSALAAADAVMFSEEARARAIPYVESFAKRRGWQLRGKEADALVSYVITALKPVTARQAEIRSANHASQRGHPTIWATSKGDGMEKIIE